MSSLCEQQLHRLRTLQDEQYLCLSRLEQYEGQLQATANAVCRLLQSLCVSENSNLIYLSLLIFYSSLNRKELLLGPLECHDDVRKRSLKQECFEMSPE